jgi:hypothetical protein
MVLESARILALAAPFLAGLFLSPGAALADIPVTMQLTGLETGFFMGGVFTSPYKIQVDGGSTLLLACDDYTTDIYIGYAWNATQYTLSDVADNGPQKFHPTTVTYPGGTQVVYTVQQMYGALGWLAEQLATDPSVLATSERAGEYSYAIWQVFDPSAIYGYNRQALTTDQQLQVSLLMQEAFSQGGVSSNYQVDIFTPDFDTPSQEFIGISEKPQLFANGLPQLADDQPVGVPEGPTAAFLAVDLLGLSGIVFLLRRRIRRNA